MAPRRVVFGRVNRRYQSSIDNTPFTEEMRLLAGLGRFEAVDGEKRWIVGDIEIDDSGTFLSGVIGFIDPETRLQFDDETDSWIKAIEETVEGASNKAVVPFAIDLRSDCRWTANATSPRVHPKTFRRGIELALNAARKERGWQTDWEVDLVASVRTIEEWIVSHPEIRLARRTIKLPNPGRDISRDIEDMRQLAARTKHEEYVAHPNQNLRAVDGSGNITREFSDFILGTDMGNIELTLVARGPGRTYKFSSQSMADETLIADFGDDWQLGIEFIRDALREYSERRANNINDSNSRW